MAATLDLSDKKFFNEGELKALFSEFDPNGQGYISKQDIINCMHRIGRDIDGKELNIIFRCHDLDKDHVISYKEFKNMIIPQN